MHVFMDSFSRRGVLWLYPLHKWRQGKKRHWIIKGYTVGGGFEMSVQFLCTLVIILFIFYVPVLFSLQLSELRNFFYFL